MTKRAPKLITPEIRARIEQALQASASEIDTEEFAEQLRNGADEHAYILRRSREQGGRRVYR